MMVKSESRSIAARALEDQAILTTLNEADLRLVMAACIELGAAAYKQWVGGAAAEQAERNGRNGEFSGVRLLDTVEMAERLGCSLQTLRRGIKAGRYPFAFKNGALWVGSEVGLEQWIKARTKRSV